MRIDLLPNQAVGKSDDRLGRFPHKAWSKYTKSHVPARSGGGWGYMSIAMTVASPLQRTAPALIEPFCSRLILGSTKGGRIPVERVADL